MNPRAIVVPGSFHRPTRVRLVRDAERVALQTGAEVVVFSGRDEAEHMIAFSADRASATISINPITQLRKLPPVENTFPANVTKIVFGSTRLEFDRACAPSTTMNEIGISV